MPGGQLPDDVAAARARPHVRQRDALVVIPQRRLPGGAELPELAEHTRDGLLYLAVGNLLD